MEIDKLIGDLKKERDRLARAIAALVGAGSTTTGKRGRKAGSPTTKRKRGGITKEGRKRLSELMKKRWQEKHRRGGSLKSGPIKGG